MARCALKRSLRPASCCSVEVMNGAAGERRKGLSVDRADGEARPDQRGGDRGGLLLAEDPDRALAICTPSSSKSRPVATGVAAQRHERGAEAGGAVGVAKVPSTPHQVAERNRMRARSRSTTMRVATLCTRPAESRGMTLRHSTGETS